MYYCSLDHDGLGRYGDPLSPDGDLLTMDTLRCIVKPGGLLFLTVPVGPDALSWNLHRRYGRLRLPLLTHGWHTVERVGWDESRVDMSQPITRTYEPVLILTPDQPPQTGDSSISGDETDDTDGDSDAFEPASLLASVAAAGDVQVPQ